MVISQMALKKAMGCPTLTRSMAPVCIDMPVFFSFFFLVSVLDHSYCLSRMWQTAASMSMPGRFAQMVAAPMGVSVQGTAQSLLSAAKVGGGSGVTTIVGGAPLSPLIF
jgi:hypothetical protein